MADADGWSAPRTSGRRSGSGRRNGLIAAAVVVALVIVYLIVVLARSSSFAPAQATRTIDVQGAALHPDWPGYGQAAFALGSGDVIATHGTQKEAATASTAKLITVLVVLGKHPLGKGQDGPTITINAADVRNYNRYVSVDGSVVPVRVGQRLTERDVIEAILLPSANNLADTLAIWAFGSLDAYRTAATAWLESHDLTHTRIGSDASGFAPSTVSTASDLVRVGQLAMADPVVRAIVAQQSADIPDDGTVNNIDSLLGSDGIVGIKTGNSDQNGGVFVGAAVKKIGGQTVTVITAISGAPSLDGVLADSRDLLVSLTGSIREHVLVHKGQSVGTYDTPDGTVSAVAARDVEGALLGTATVHVTVRLDDATPGSAGRSVGTIEVPSADGHAATTVPAVLADAVQQPSLVHRVLHP